MVRTTVRIILVAVVALWQPRQFAAHDWQTHPQTAVDASLACDASKVNHSKIVVAAVGDSITVGFNCETWSGGFVKVLQDVLGEDQYDVRDCGLCGHDAVRAGHGNVLHPSYWETGAHNQSKLMKPDVVIYMFGTNDAFEWYNTSKYYTQDMTDLISEYASLENKPKVHTMIPPPFMNYTCVDHPPCWTTTRVQTSVSNTSCTINCLLPQIIPKISSEVDLPAPVDLLTFLGGPTDTNKTAIDSLHPNCAGYTLIGRHLAKQLFGVGASVVV